MLGESRAGKLQRARVCHPQDAEGDESGGQQRRKSVGQHGEPGVDLAQLFPPLIFDGEGSQRARSQQNHNNEDDDGDARTAASVLRSAAVNAVLSHARSVAPGVVGQASRPVRCATCVLDNMNALFEYSERPSPIGASLNVRFAAPLGVPFGTVSPVQMLLPAKTTVSKSPIMNATICTAEGSFTFNPYTLGTPLETRPKLPVKAIIVQIPKTTDASSTPHAHKAQSLALAS